VICSYRAQANKEAGGDPGSRGELFGSRLQFRPIERAKHCNGFDMRRARENHWLASNTACQRSFVPNAVDHRDPRQS